VKRFNGTNHIDFIDLSRFMAHPQFVQGRMTAMPAAIARDAVRLLEDELMF
jgi:hypothetical protein